MQEIDRLKSEGRYYQAGALAASLGYGPEYGCHFGMRSDYQYARAQYALGWHEATHAINSNR
jgi:hypothetical protein